MISLMFLVARTHLGKIPPQIKTPVCLFTAVYLVIGGHSSQ